MKAGPTTQSKGTASSEPTARKPELVAFAVVPWKFQAATFMKRAPHLDVPARRS